MAEKLKITYRAPSSLTPYGRNARTHSAEQVAQIGRSIQEFGWTNPILVDEAGGIIAGHGRLAAALELGLDKVPTICVAGLTETQVRALVIADNNLALNAGWDADILGSEIEALTLGDFDLSLLGFGEAELSGITGAADEIALPSLNSGDREPFQQMTFTVHDTQKEQVDAAMAAAKALGPFDSPNENSNGNALARVCETYLTQHGNA